MIKISRTYTEIDITGQKFNLLTAVTSTHRKNGQTYWLFKCDCGNEKIINKAEVKRGKSKSCGCLAGTGNKSHNKSGSYTYQSWLGMKNRCNNPNFPKYENYGRRGIKVCERWLNSFENFLADMGERHEGKTLDRIDNNGNYEPSNCRWATPKEQANNRTTTIKVKIGNNIRSLKEWSEILEMSYDKVRDSFLRSGNLNKFI